MTSHFDDSPTSPNQSDRARRSDWSASTVEMLLRHDEATAPEKEQLLSDPTTARALRHLQRVDAFLESGGLSESGMNGTAHDGQEAAPQLAPESLYAYGCGELDQDAETEVAAYLADHPEEARWAESLRHSPPPPVPLHWVSDKEGESVKGAEPPAEESLPAQASTPALRVVRDEALEPQPVPSPAVNPQEKPLAFPSWLAWTPMAAAALILAMAIGGTGRRSVLEGGLPDSPIVRSAGSEALLFPRGRVLASSAAVRTYASEPLFEVTPVDGATLYSFELRDVTESSAFAEGDLLWQGTSTTHEVAAPKLEPGSYTWTATARVKGIDRSLGSLSFTVLPASAVDRALFIRAAVSSGATMPGVLREDIRRLHASGYLTDARGKARALPPGAERDAYLAIPTAE